jgi:hypothetical protein
MIKSFKKYIKDIEKYIEKKNKKTKSVYFITMHKCGSTIFKEILNNIIGLKHVDYAGRVHENTNYSEFNFRKNGYIYGPLMIAEKNSIPGYRLLDNHISNFKTHFKSRIIFMVRDPRDIIVSAYHSFGKTHKLSNDNTIAQFQLLNRNRIQRTTIDEYAYSEVEKIRLNFRKIIDLSKLESDNIILKYEDLIDDFNAFWDNISNFVEINQHIRDNFFNATRPRQELANDSHKRSGKTKQYISELSVNTIDMINEHLKEEIKFFKYT